MSVFILLTAGQAASVRGPSVSMAGASLEPIERQGGVFILGAGVLMDPAHEVHRAYLAELPRRDSEDPDFPPSLQERG